MARPQPLAAIAMKTRRPLCIPACLLAAMLCAPAYAAPAAAENPPHPLTHRIWDTRAQRFIERTVLEDGLRNAHFVLLGEVHDNAGHHRLRRDLIATLVDGGRRPAIAMEQFDREYQAALDRALDKPSPEADAVKNAVHFNDKGWSWPHYEPIVRLALENGLPLRAANLSRTDAFRVAIEGAAAVFGADRVQALGLEAALPESARRKLEEVIEKGHCGKAPRDRLAGIVAAQRARDAVMAEALRRDSAAGAVLIAGNGHVRRDFGVPHYLGGDGIVVVGFLEVRKERSAPTDYYEQKSPEYDYIVFTPRTPRPDPCADIRFRPVPRS